MGEVGWEKSISTVGFGPDVIVACRCLSHNGYFKSIAIGPSHYAHSQERLMPCAGHNRGRSS